MVRFSRRSAQLQLQLNILAQSVSLRSNIRPQVFDLFRWHYQHPGNAWASARK